MDEFEFLRDSLGRVDLRMIFSSNIHGDYVINSLTIPLGSGKILNYVILAAHDIVVMCKNTHTFDTQMAHLCK